VEMYDSFATVSEYMGLVGSRKSVWSKAGSTPRLARPVQRVELERHVSTSVTGQRQSRLR
jgi:hypothetical protein